MAFTCSKCESSTLMVYWPTVDEIEALKNRGVSLRDSPRLCHPCYMALKQLEQKEADDANQGK